MARWNSYRAKTTLQALFAAFWIALAAAGSAVAADFDDGFTSYISGNYSQAFSIWEPLAEAGEIEAQFGLGLLYEQGRGTLRDLEAAAAWYGRAAGQGSMRAQTQLGGMYARGDGVPENWSQALRWWRRAADQGSMRARFHLGQAYHYGSGVDRDLDIALQWYDEAATLGFRPAARQVLEIKRQWEEEAKAAAALAASDPESPGSGGSGVIVLALSVPKTSSVLHETANDLDSHGAAPLIALSVGSTRPLDGSHRIYLASYRGIQKANEGWQGLAAANPDLLGGLEAAVAQADLGREKGIVYRLQAGPLADTVSANALCYKLSQRNIPCVVVTP